MSELLKTAHRRFQPGAAIWYRPACLGYGYDWWTAPDGIPAHVADAPHQTHSERFGDRVWIAVTFLTKDGSERIHTKTVVGNVARRKS